ncbi:DUF4405 domain-containing protein [Bacteroides sp.]|uniref:DUF4405 domain-containing protein n=1 Tax=Bacteroides sp. TaxID=29523 RepID=UPI0026340A3A|nr:DUF4405 domain-containing protein [Bacteroides sp.]MDD3040843.1 DUF4405 domain-containing protein [Bacteroides sp.]
MSKLHKNLIIDLVLLVSSLGCIASGFMFHFRFFGMFDAKTLVDFHVWCSYVLLVSGLAHLAFHITWLKSALQNFCK